MEKAIILCAGRGKRLGPLTESTPKPLVEVNGISIFENTIKNLIEANYKELVVVVGYQKEKFNSTIKKYEEEINFKVIENNQWESKNNIYSLWLAKDEMKTNFTLIEGDFYFKSSILEVLNEESTLNNTLLISPLTNLMEGLCVEDSIDNMVYKFLDTKKNQHKTSKSPFKVANIFNISKTLAEFMIKEMEKEINQGNVSVGYEYTFNAALDNKIIFNTIKIPSDEWYEIDNAYDLNIAEYQFSPNKYEQLNTKHGGFWRFPLKDFSLIYNFYFPPESLKQNMIERFDSLLLNYPSTLSIITKYLARFLKINDDYLAVSNGTSEIMKILPNIFTGKVILTEPSFNEYKNCFKNNQSIIFELKEEDNFDINILDLINVLEKEEPEVLILNSPNNPTGRLIKKEDIISIYRATKELNTLIILDESFLDFSIQRVNGSFMHILEEYPRVIILKSMSKTFGIGGIRLGYAATANIEILSKIKESLPIWNINSFAEELILNLSAFEEEYMLSCKKVREDTDDLLNQLKEINQLKVFDTDANFIICKILNKDISAVLFSETLLENKGCYIKECSGKDMKDSNYFIRISSRKKEENIKLVEAIKETFEAIEQKNVNIFY